MDAIWAQFSVWITNILSVDTLLQLFALILALLLGGLLAKLLFSQIAKLEQRAKQSAFIQDMSWILDLFPLLQTTLFPLITLLLVNASTHILIDLDQPVNLLEWIIPFITLWLIYRLLSKFVELQMSPEHARVWTKQIIRPIIYFFAILMLIGLFDDFLETSFRLSQEVLITFRSLFTGVILIAFFWFLGRQVQKFLNRIFFPRLGVEIGLNNAVSNLIYYVLILAGLFIGITAIGIDLTVLIVLLGGLSVGIGFGLQSLANNWISGFILMFERIIKPDDVIEVNGKITKVVKTGLRTTTVRTNANVEIIVPNGKLLEDPITNYTLSEREAEIPIDVGVSYSVDLHKVFALLLQATDEHEEVIYGLLRLQDFTEGVFVVRLMAYIGEPIKIFKIQHELRVRIWELFKENDIELAYPERNVRFQMGEPIPINSMPSAKDEPAQE